MWISKIFNRDESVDERFRENHKVGFLTIPENIKELPSLCACHNFLTPDRIDERPRMTKCEDQGSKPWCAAYAATQFAENILWRKNGFPEEIDPSWVYSDAKKLDGSPDTDGTTLNAVFQAMLNKGTFDSDICRIRIVMPTEANVKFAIHKFGVMLAGFNITEEWYRVNPNKTAICSKNRLPGIGGHAVVIVGFEPSGAYIMNSWSSKWGNYGTALITWDKLYEQMMYGAVIENCLDGMRMN